MFTTKINPTLSPDCLHWKDDDGRRWTMTEIAGVMGLMYARECLLMVLKESLHF